MKTTKEKEIEFYKFMDQLLWEKWDPIRLNNDIDARNEYYGYIPIILEKSKNKNEHEVANTLHEIEKNRMGLYGDYEKCLLVAKEIISYIEKYS